MPDDVKIKLLKLMNERIGLDPKVYERYAPRPAGRVSVQDGDSNVIYIEGPIVDVMYGAFYEEWYGEGVVTTRKNVRERLEAIDGDVELRVNSPGGDIWEASAIRELFLARQRDGDKIESQIEGLCASAATFMIASCDRITMTDLSSYMIHRASSFMYGTGEDFIRWGEHLTGLDDVIAAIYADRMTDGVENILDMMSKETWFTASEALEAGIIDAIKDGTEEEPPVDAIVQERNLRMSQLDKLGKFAALSHV